MTQSKKQSEVQPFGTSPFVPATPTGATGELETDFYEERVVAPAPGGSVSLSRGPLVAQNTTVRNSAGTEYALGLDYFETLATSPGRIENLTIPAGTELVVGYFYYETGDVNGASSSAADESRGRFATHLKLGG